MTSKPSPEFAARLSEACNEHPPCPPLNKGRLTWIKSEFFRHTGRSLSVEAVRKWLSGEAWPRRESVAALAAIFGVDPVWLETGYEKRVASAVETHEPWARNLSVEIRPGVRVDLVGLPGDLNANEARHLSALIMASASDTSTVHRK